jgi:purine-binding chemotaxis protein CheW
MNESEQKIDQKAGAGNSNVGGVIESVLNKEKRPEDKIIPTKQIVTFELDKEEYASIITDLREVINIPEIVTIPGGPDFIAGILNLRGQIVVVIDLEKRFNLVKDNQVKPRHIIIAEVGDNIFGIIVDEVTGVLRVPEASIKPTPPLVTSKIKADYLKGVVVLEEQEEESNEETKNNSEENSKTNLTVKPTVQLSTEKIQIEAKPKKETKPKDVVKHGSRLIILLDIPKMLAEQELMEFGSFIKQSVNPANAVDRDTKNT